MHIPLSYILFAHGPASSDRDPAAVWLVEMAPRKGRSVVIDGDALTPAIRAELKSAAELYVDPDSRKDYPIHARTARKVLDALQAS